MTVEELLIRLAGLFYAVGSVCLIAGLALFIFRGIGILRF